MSPHVVPPIVGPLPLRRKALLAVEILATYARIRWLMRDENALEAVPRIRGRMRRRVVEHATPAETYHAGKRLGRIVVRTLSPLPYDSRCLFRSLTLSALLQRRGIPATLVIAVRPQPFEAHAWVEHEGRPLLDPGPAGFERVAEL